MRFVKIYQLHKCLRDYLDTPLTLCCRPNKINSIHFNWGLPQQSIENMLVAQSDSPHANISLRVKIIQVIFYILETFSILNGVSQHACEIPHPTGSINMLVALHASNSPHANVSLTTKINILVYLLCISFMQHVKWSKSML